LAKVGIFVLVLLLFSYLVLLVSHSSWPTNPALAFHDAKTSLLKPPQNTKKQKKQKFEK